MKNAGPDPRRRVWLAAALLAAACAAPSRAPGTPATVREVRQSVGGPTRDIELRAIATADDREAGILYVQDATGSVALEVGDLGEPVVSGSVLLAGTLEPRTPIPRFRVARLTLLGPLNPEILLVARPVDAAIFASDEADGEWVEVHGVVRAQSRHGSSMRLEIESGARFSAEVRNLDDSLYSPLIGARLRLRGVKVMRTQPAPRPAVGLLVPDLKYLRIEEDPPEDPDRRPTAATLPLLTTAAAVRQLPPEEAEKGYPVRLRAVVTAHRPDFGLLFVQDSTAGIYVEAWRHIHHVTAGDLVEIDGQSGRGSFAPVVERPRVRVVGRGSIPARRVRPEELVTGQEDSQLVELEGMVRGIKLYRDGATMRLAAGGVRIPVHIQRTPDMVVGQQLVNARVRVRGVCQSLYTQGSQFADVALHIPDLDSVSVLAPAPPEDEDGTVRHINTLLQFAAGQDWERRTRVQGVVTYSEPDELYIRDETGAVRVYSDQEPPPAVGEVVDVSGFAAAGRYKPVLQDAVVRSLAKGLPPAAVPIRAEQALTGLYDGSLVELDARLVESERGLSEQQLFMRTGPYLFTAVLPGMPIDGLRPGAGLRLRGVCSVTANDQRIPQSFRLRLRTPADVEVVSPAPWWSLQHAAWALAAMVGAVGLTLAWVVTLRRRVQAQSRVIWERVQRETAMQERQRMARELHDTLEQNFTGIHLCVEAARRALPDKSAVADRHLTLALEQVTAGIEEVRRSVWALRTHALDSGGLATALGEIGQLLANCSPTPIEVSTNIEGGPRPLVIEVENNLLRIGQEALTNAVRHGAAKRIAVELRYDVQSFHMRVSDDGCGFDVTAATRPGHFGLLGMRERAAAMGARLEVRSAVGEGTEVAVTVPLQLTLPQAG
jgi:signal transduction histidine kinase